MKYTCDYLVKSDERGYNIEYNLKLNGVQRISDKDHYSRFQATESLMILSNFLGEFDNLITKAIFEGSKKGRLEINIDGYSGQSKSRPISVKASIAESKNEFDIKFVGDLPKCS